MGSIKALSPSSAFARKTHKDVKEQKSGEFWDEVRPHFYEHLEEINRNLKAAGRPELEVKAVGEETKPESVSSEEWQAVVTPTVVE